MCYIIDVWTSLTCCRRSLLCFMRKWEGPGVFFLSFSLVTLNTHISPSHYPSPSSPFPSPRPVPTLFNSLWSCTGVLGQQLARGEQNVFGVCLVSNRMVIIVSGCHFGRWRGPFSVRAPPTGESDRLKRSSLEGGKGRCVGLVNLWKLTNTSSTTRVLTGVYIV